LHKRRVPPTKPHKGPSPPTQTGGGGGGARGFVGGNKGTSRGQGGVGRDTIVLIPTPPKIGVGASGVLPTNHNLRRPGEGEGADVWGGWLREKPRKWLTGTLGGGLSREQKLFSFFPAKTPPSIAPFCNTQNKGARPVRLHKPFKFPIKIKINRQKGCRAHRRTFILPLRVRTNRVGSAARLIKPDEFPSNCTYPSPSNLVQYLLGGKRGLSAGLGSAPSLGGRGQNNPRGGPHHNGAWSTRGEQNKHARRGAAPWVPPLKKKSPPQTHNTHLTH